MGSDFLPYCVLAGQPTYLLWICFRRNSCRQYLDCDSSKYVYLALISFFWQMIWHEMLMYLILISMILSLDLQEPPAGSSMFIALQWKAMSSDQKITCFSFTSWASEIQRGWDSKRWKFDQNNEENMGSPLDSCFACWYSSSPFMHTCNSPEWSSQSQVGWDEAYMITVLSQHIHLPAHLWAIVCCEVVARSRPIKSGDVQLHDAWHADRDCARLPVCCLVTCNCSICRYLQEHKYLLALYTLCYVKPFKE